MPAPQGLGSRVASIFCFLMFCTENVDIKINEHNHCLSCWHIYFGHYIVDPWINGFLLPLWYLQRFFFRHYTVYKGSKHQTNTLLSPETMPWCTRGQNIKHILYYPQTLYRVQGVKTSNKYFIIPRNYTVVYKGIIMYLFVVLSPCTPRYSFWG
jgi:hypothetical protein